ncbi:MAG: hypothetical protein KA100_06190 [Rickettsiales bacterium]|nr:hypothetical protein [Rickettsiales bacterium]
MIREKLEQLKKSQKSGAKLAEELAKIIAARAKESPTEIVAEIAAINEFISQHPELVELENSTHQQINDTLLYKLAAGVPNPYSIEIINHLIAQCRDLSGRHDLLLVMIKDRTISRDPDMSQTFDLLVEKGLPKPNSEQIASLVSDSRLRQGFNATKLAKSFLNKRQDPSLIRQILESRRGEERQALEDFLTKGAFEQFFHKHIANLVRVNNDTLLKATLNRKKSSQLLQESADHSEALNLAAAHKYVETFKILIEAGFDPRKHQEGAPNCIALACQAQGKSTLHPYLVAIREKFGPEVLAEILREGESSITHAIRGRAYIGTIKLLLENGAAIEQNYLQNLKTLVRKGDAGAFEFLLKKGRLNQEEFSAVFEVVKNESDYVVASAFLDYLKKQNPPLASELEPEMKEKHQKLSEQNLFEICKLSGEKTFASYVANKAAGWIQRHVNSLDKEEKTALYYAIADNAYYNLVKLLLEAGANPNFIAREEGSHATLNAATLAVRNSEPATLGLILQSRNLSSESIRAAAVELVKEENNEAVLTEAFVGGLEVEKLAALPLEVRQVLLERSLELKQPQLVQKIASSSPQGDLAPLIEKLFSKAIEAADVDQVKIIVQDLEVKKLLSSRVRRSALDLCSLESEPLLGESKSYGTAEIPNASCSSSLAQKLNTELDKQYTDRAFEIAASTSEKSESAKAIFKILVEAGFETSKSEREIKSLKIDGEGRSAWCPSLETCCIIS